MATAPDPSERLVRQRMRNRAIEALEAIADGDEGVRSMGVGEYVEEFFDIIDDRAPWRWRTWSVFTPDEVQALEVVHDLLVQACAETPQVPTPGGIFADDNENFIRTGWPARIQPAAASALDLMLTRGRFSEEREEVEPGRAS
ncbi:hypothetical protein [Nocardioides acrostichi]|uniref:Uncharacterized protein n=1 Tax=Nocardioides acrostichi TaxID=2784339 RepID=A0A930Y9C4_9ACTN|nr:hypothetical protein [Nocardioides acrostichi]MBF4163971.1 hypothetical protein [Nocardioides acrostichi]